MTPAEAREALERLPPEDRALLELSLRREVADLALAELLHIPAGEVAGRREAALEQLVGEARGAPRAELEDALIEHWRGRSAVAASSGPSVGARAAATGDKRIGLALLAGIVLAWRLGRSGR
ncbi:MAG: hypothetical protein ABR581_07900 [Thermoleophilaceae bacterium]